MLELVRRRHPDEQQVRLVRVRDVLEHREVRGLPVEPLLDVRLLRHDARLEHREVRGGRRLELLGEVLGEVAAEARLARPAGPGRERAADGGVEQPHPGEARVELLDADQHARGETGRRAVRDLHLDVRPLALAKDPDGVGGALRAREEDTVVVRGAVVRRVDDVRVQAVLVGAEVEHAHAHLLRRAERRRQSAGPAGRSSRRGAGERRLARVPGGMVELKPERGDERHVVEQDVAGGAGEVRRDAAAREEGAEVDRRPLRRGVPAAGPLDLRDLESRPLGGLRDRLRLEHAGVERRGAVGERLAVPVEGVVRGAVDARPRAGRERVPARPRVRRAPASRGRSPTRTSPS